MPIASRFPELRVWLALGGLIVAHGAVDVFFFPVGFFSPWMRTLQLGVAGVTISQPLLLAMVAVFWPGRRAVRLSATVALLVLMAYALVIGQGRHGPAEAIAALAFVPMSVVFQLPLRVVRWLWRWTIVRQGVEQASRGDSRFSVRDLLVAMAGAGVLFGLGRWILPAADWHATSSNLRSVVTQSSEIALVYSAAGLPSIALVPLALGSSRRRAALLAFLLAALVTLGVLLLAVSQYSPRGLNGDDIAELCAINLGAYPSIFVSLLVVRACGFRLISKPTDAGGPDAQSVSVCR